MVNREAWKIVLIPKNLLRSIGWWLMSDAYPFRAALKKEPIEISQSEILDFGKRQRAYQIRFQKPGKLLSSLIVEDLPELVEKSVPQREHPLLQEMKAMVPWIPISPLPVSMVTLSCIVALFRFLLNHIDQRAACLNLVHASPNDSACMDLRRSSLVAALSFAIFLATFLFPPLYNKILNKFTKIAYRKKANLIVVFLCFPAGIAILWNLLRQYPPGTIFFNWDIIRYLRFIF